MNKVQLISKGIFIIPNTSKTEKEILQFNYELGSNLPFISENGSVINGLELFKLKKFTYYTCSIINISINTHEIH